MIKDCEVGPGRDQIPQMIDIIGLILSVEPLGQIQLKNTGEMRDRR